MKFTKKQREAIEIALIYAQRARAYLAQPDIAVGILNRPATTTLHYTRADGSTFYPLDKQIGSELCSLETCIDTLTHILAPSNAPER